MQGRRASLVAAAADRMSPSPKNAVGIAAVIVARALLVAEQAEQPSARRCCRQCRTPIEFVRAADVVDAGRRARSLLAPLPPQGDCRCRRPSEPKALWPPLLDLPIIERMPLSSSEPPIMPAAAAAAVPRKEPPAEAGLRAAGGGGCCTAQARARIAAEAVQARPRSDCQAGDSPARVGPHRGHRAGARAERSGACCRGSSYRAARRSSRASSSRMRASARLSASSCTSTVCTSA